MRISELIRLMVAITAIASFPIAANAGSIQDRKGFAVYEAVAEAGVHPRRPHPGDQKVMTRDGHAYWLRPEPVFVGGITGVEPRESGCDRTTFHLPLTAAAQAAFLAFTSRSDTPSFAVVADGRIVGPVIRAMGPIDTEELRIESDEPNGAWSWLQPLALHRPSPAKLGIRSEN